MRPFTLQKTGITRLLSMFLLLQILMSNRTFAHGDIGFAYAGLSGDFTAANGKQDYGAYGTLGLFLVHSYLNVDVGKRINSDAFKTDLEFGRLFGFGKFDIPIFPVLHAGLSFSKYSGLYAGIGLNIYLAITINYSVYYYPDQNPYFGQNIVENNIRIRASFPLLH